MAISSYVVSLLILLACHGSNEEECPAGKSKESEMSFNISSSRNESGSWVSYFSARKESDSISSDINAGATFKVSECREKQIVHIQGVLREATDGNSLERNLEKKMERNVEKAAVKIEWRWDEKLSFHPNCGTNIAITSDGRSIVKKVEDEAFNGVTLTKRPLKDDELFEVRLDKKISKYNMGMGIGVTTHDPSTLEIPKHMNDLTDGTWMMYFSNVYMNGSIIKTSFTRDLKHLKVGDRLGVKVKENGALHLLVNGVDQGRAAARIPPNVFGVYELYRDAVAASIIDPVE